jgi:hypothetical protein
MAGIVGLTCLKGKSPEKCLEIILDRLVLYLLDAAQQRKTNAVYMQLSLQSTHLLAL